jgi:hypothetical protein
MERPGITALDPLPDCLRLTGHLRTPFAEGAAASGTDCDSAGPIPEGVGGRLVPHHRGLLQLYADD